MFLGKCFVKMRYLQSDIIIFIAKVKLSYQSEIIVYSDIRKYSNIAGCIFKNVELNKRYRDLKGLKNI